MGNKKRALGNLPTFDNDSIGDLFNNFINSLEKATGQEVLLETDKNGNPILIFEDDPNFKKTSDKMEIEADEFVKNPTKIKSCDDFQGKLTKDQINKLYDPTPFIEYRNKINGLKNLVMKNDFKPDESETC